MFDISHLCKWVTRELWPCVCEIYNRSLKNKKKINDQMIFTVCCDTFEFLNAVCYLGMRVISESGFLTFLGIRTQPCSFVSCIRMSDPGGGGGLAVDGNSLYLQHLVFALPTCIPHITQQHICFFRRGLTSPNLLYQTFIIHANLLGIWPLTIIARLLIWNLSLA